jgi:hypothetical protein
MLVVPRGVEHCPRADEEAHILVIESEGTPNTGDAGGPMTLRKRRSSYQVPPPPLGPGGASAEPNSDERSPILVPPILVGTFGATITATLPLTGAYSIVVDHRARARAASR